MKRHGNWKKRNEESKNSKKRQKENRKKLYHAYSKGKQRKSVEKKNSWRTKPNGRKRFT